MRPAYLLLLVLVAGCQHTQLRQQTVWQARTLTDLEYQQVLDNLAMLAENPEALPFFVAPGAGQTNVRQDFTANATFGWDLLAGLGPLANQRFWYFDKASTTPGATNSSQEQWTTSPVVNPDELDLMRCAYKKTLGLQSPECDGKLGAFFKSPETHRAMQPGWYGIGKKCDIPKGIHCVGKYGDTCVWVPPEGIEQLTTLTLAILDIATTAVIEVPARLDPEVAKAKREFTKAQVIADLLNKYPKDKDGRFMTVPASPSSGAEKALVKLDQFLGDYVTPKRTADGRVEEEAELPTPRIRKNLYNPLLLPLNP